MITYRSGDLLSSDMQTLVNTVNCVGVMGKGIALQFKNRYPEMYRDYEYRCRRDEVKPGVPYRYPPVPASAQLPLRLTNDVASSESDRIIVNFPTKNHWRGKSKLEWVEAGLERLVENCRSWGVQSLATPALGCGHGGLEWNDVGPLMAAHLSALSIPVEVFVPSGIDPTHPLPSDSRILVAAS